MTPARREDLGANAPIHEALIDIQTTLPKDVTLADLKALHEEIKDRFPRERKRLRFETHIRKGEATVKQPTADGWLFNAPDDKEVVQFRLDGFTFNKLHPYEGWGDFSGKAREFWTIFREGVQPHKVTRLGLRYINRIRIPQGGDLDRYFSTAPQIPSGVPQGLSSYFTRVVVPDPASGASATITQSWEGLSRRDFHLLDIDVCLRDFEPEV